MDQCPGLELVSCEQAKEWTGVLVWNWCPVNGLMVGPVFQFETGTMRKDDQQNQLLLDKMGVLVGGKLQKLMNKRIKKQIVSVMKNILDHLN